MVGPIDLLSAAAVRFSPLLACGARFWADSISGFRSPTGPPAKPLTSSDFSPAACAEAVLFPPPPPASGRGTGSNGLAFGLAGAGGSFTGAGPGLLGGGPPPAPPPPPAGGLGGGPCGSGAGSLGLTSAPVRFGSSTEECAGLFEPATGIVLANACRFEPNSLAARISAALPPRAAT